MSSIHRSCVYIYLHIQTHALVRHGRLIPHARSPCYRSQNEVGMVVSNKLGWLLVALRDSLAAEFALVEQYEQALSEKIIKAGPEVR
mgnify:CR=1 FL=1